MNQRRYRGEPSRPLPLWNGILEHFDAMGMSIWLYIWCLDRITREEDGIGFVFGGAPVKVEQIAKELGRSDRALRRDLKTLKSRYLRLRWTPYGYVIHVLNSRKFGIWRPLDSLAKNGQADSRNGEADGKSGEARTKNGRSKEDAAIAAVDTAVKQQPAATPNPEDSVWDFLSITPCGPIPFLTLLESRWSTKNGEPCSVLIGETVDAWETANGVRLRLAAPLFRALDRLRRDEKQAPRQPVEASAPIHTFKPEEIPA